MTDSVIALEWQVSRELSFLNFNLDNIYPIQVNFIIYSKKLSLSLDVIIKCTFEIGEMLMNITNADLQQNFLCKTVISGRSRIILSLMRNMEIVLLAEWPVCLVKASGVEATH